MFQRIVGFFLIGFMFLALVLHFAGIEKVEFDASYYRFMSMVNERLSQWRFEIPSIPYIDIPDTGNVIFDTIWDVSFALPNAISMLVNSLVWGINYIIGLIQYVLTIISIVVDFPKLFI